jgi:hypothetical protein
MSIQRKFTWEGHEAERFQLRKHAQTMKALQDKIFTDVPITSAAYNEIVLALHGKSDNPLFVSYAEENTAIHEICKELIGTHNMDYSIVISEHQSILFPGSYGMWKQNMERAMINSHDILAQK